MSHSYRMVAPPAATLLLWTLISGCGKDEKKPTAPVNDPPMACFAVTPPVGTTETLFSLDASCAADRQDSSDALMVRWDWEDDSTWDTDWTAVKEATHRYEVSGRKVVHLEVRDHGGLSAEAHDTLEVTEANVAPGACFSVAPREGSTATSFEVNASCSSDPQDNPDSLEVRWDWEDDGDWDTDWTNSKSATHRFPTVGLKMLRVEVRDTGGLTATKRDSVSVGIDYFGEPPPGLTPKVFAPGLISNAATGDYACTFSPLGNEFYFTRSTSTGQYIYETHLTGGAWTLPSPVSFSSGYGAHEPHLTYDNGTIYFGWFRPVPPGEPSSGWDYGIWATDRTATGWAPARYVGQGMFVSSSRDGQVYVTDTPYTQAAIARATMTNGRFSGLERIRPGAHPCIAPDGSYLVYDINGGNHLMVCFRQEDGTWGPGIDLTTHGLPADGGIASVSPDGKYLFYIFNHDLYWVSTALIESLRDH
jgi:hypothetical protein